MKNYRFATSHLPDVVKEFAQHDSVRQKVAIIESLLASGETEFGQNWPAEYVNHVSGEIFQDMQMISAVRVISSSTMINIVDSVRTQLLTFILELEQKDSVRAQVDS